MLGVQVRYWAETHKSREVDTWKITGQNDTGRQAKREGDGDPVFRLPGNFAVPRGQIVLCRRKRRGEWGTFPGPRDFGLRYLEWEYNV